MDLTTLSSGEFTRALASKAPAPGGGGASAMVSAMGASLASMAAILSRGKPSLMQYSDELCTAVEKAEELRQRCMQLVNEDAEAFTPLSKVYAMPKDDPGRPEAMEAALKAAADVPMRIFRAACEGIDLHGSIEEKCSKLLISDIATGVSLCRSALYGAAVNVFVNTRLMKDRQYADGIDSEIKKLLPKYGRMADGIFERICEDLK